MAKTASKKLEATTYWKLRPGGKYPNVVINNRKPMLLAVAPAEDRTAMVYLSRRDAKRLSAALNAFADGRVKLVGPTLAYMRGPVTR